MTPEVVNAQGRTIYVRANDKRAQKLAEAHGDFNPDSLSLWNAMIGLGEPWDLVVDIGANYGEMLAGSTVTPGKRVVAFEPNPAIAELLSRTTSELPFAVEVVASAVSSTIDAQVSFLSDKEWSGTSHLAAVESGLIDDRYEVLNVPTTTLDAHFTEPIESAFIKIDVEGAEMHVLAGAERFLADTRHVAIMMEILHMPVQDVWRLRHDYQMALWSAEAGGPVLIDARSADELGQLLHSGTYYRQDAVFLSGSDASGLAASLRGRWGTSRQRAERLQAEFDDAEAARAAAWNALQRQRDDLEAAHDELKAAHEELKAAHHELETARDTLASALTASQRNESALRAERNQLALELEVRAAELKLRGAELASSAAQLTEASEQSHALRTRIGELEREIRIFKRSRAYRWASVYGGVVRRFRRR